jgi:methionine-rich copper-binding protein CopC
MAGVYLQSNRRARVIRIAVWAAIVGLLLGVLSSLALAGSAEAHAALQSITPADGARLAQAPTQVVLTFDEAVSTSFATVTVSDPAGKPVTQGAATVDGAVVTQTLAPGLGAGQYVVAFRVVSDDGHPISERTTFTVLSSTPSSPADAAAPTATPLAEQSSPSGADAALPADATTDNSTEKRVALAVGVGALALAVGTALVAMSRRGRAT